MNSKWTAHPPTKYSGDALIHALLISPDGTTHEVDRDYFAFAYDYSILHETKEILVWADFKLKKSNPVDLIQHTQDAQNHRRETQPFGIPSSGCFFQNIDGESVGKIIDELGLKGHTIGGAQISTKHANFIVNTGDATAEDVQQLVAYIKDQVREKRGIELIEEVVCL